MPSDSEDDRPVRGRPFAPGNPGRPPGSRNKVTQLATTLLLEAAPELAQVLIDKAKAGDIAALKFLLSRLLPKDRFIELEPPPLNNSSDAVAALATLFEDVATGRVTPAEAAALAALVDGFSRALNVQELETRLEIVEEKLKET